MKQISIRYEKTHLSSIIDPSKDFNKTLSNIKNFINEVIKIKSENPDCAIVLSCVKNNHENINITESLEGIKVVTSLFSYVEEKDTIKINLATDYNDKYKPNQSILIDKKENIGYIIIDDNYMNMSLDVNDLNNNTNIEINLRDKTIQNASYIKDIKNNVDGTIYKTIKSKKQPYEIESEDLFEHVVVDKKRLILQLKNCQFSHIIIDLNNLNNIDYKINSKIFSLISKNNSKLKTGEIISTIKEMEVNKNHKITDYIKEHISDHIDFQKIIDDNYALKIIDLETIVKKTNECLNGFKTISLEEDDYKELVKVIKETNIIKVESSKISNSFLGDIEMLEIGKGNYSEYYFNLEKLKNIKQKIESEFNIKINNWNVLENDKYKL